MIYFSLDQLLSNLLQCVEGVEIKENKGRSFGKEPVTKRRDSKVEVTGLHTNVKLLPEC